MELGVFLGLRVQSPFHMLQIKNYYDKIVMYLSPSSRVQFDVHPHINKICFMERVKILLSTNIRSHCRSVFALPPPHQRIWKKHIRLFLMNACSAPHAFMYMFSLYYMLFTYSLAQFSHQSYTSYGGWLLYFMVYKYSCKYRNLCAR